MTSKKYKYLFGPVPSRRFGRSLGVDLIPYKTCSLNCVFCNLGRTLHPTIERIEYVPTADIINELKHWLNSRNNADYITLSGSGEPTLHSKFGKILQFLQDHTDIPSVILSNGTLFHLKEVREAALTAHIVKFSLSVWNQASYITINRPHSQLTFEMLIEGQKEFRKQFKGQIWMEVFLIAGMNTLNSDVKKIASVVSSINPDRIQLNTAVRPPAEDYVSAVSKEQLEELCQFFHPKAEVIGDYSSKHVDSFQVNQEQICSMIQRRPCTIDQIVKAFNMHMNEVSKYLEKLTKANKIYSVRKNNDIYYIAVR